VDIATAMGEILDVNGPIVTVHLPGVLNGAQVSIGTLNLIGEVIGLDGEQAVVQVYESTESLRPGEKVEPLHHPLVAELGPGLLGQIFDGVQRPLASILERSGAYLTRGLNLSPLDRQKTWTFTPSPDHKPGQRLEGGEVLGTVQETPSFVHRILVPPDLGGELLELAPTGDYTVDQVIARLRDRTGSSSELKLYHSWPVRRPRPYRRREAAGIPLITGQRILDTFFPLLKGGKAAIPGPFGAGKTMVQQQIARWSNADIVIFVGCGERGNELVDILETFPMLTDPYSGRPLMERTLLVANTSNMPVVAREASIYVGITLGEYFRDQGYDVVVVADSTSRWAEALREVAGRLGQMPVEEGHPAYLASRLAAFYERAGCVETLAGKHGSVTLIGAVSPPGGDFSEPVTSHTKDIVQTFWALSKSLADMRHYPAIDWTASFSAYVGAASPWWADHVDPNWAQRRTKAMELLTEADELAYIVNLVGPEALSPEQRWVLESAGLIREGVLQQSALDPVDSFCSPQKQFVLLDLILEIHRQGTQLLTLGMPVQQLLNIPLLGHAKRLKTSYGNDQIETLSQFAAEIQNTFERFFQDYALPPPASSAVADEEQKP
jgi:V/A-type H+/Na+-transporting ATPase subunit A